MFDQFLTVLELQSSSIFTDAAYKINESRQKVLREPERVADDNDIKKNERLYFKSYQDY